MPQAINSNFRSPATPNVNEPKKRAWSCVVLSIGAALAASYAGMRSSPVKNALDPQSVEAGFLRNGTFGAPLADGQRLDGVVVSRGDRVSNVINDPYCEGAGIILSDQAKKIFDQHRDKPKYAGPEGQFKLAILAAKKTREKFMARPVYGTHGQNDIASIQMANSNAVKGGSPLLSLTLNNYTAAYFALGGVDDDGIQKPVNQDGKVFLGQVNNASTIYPVVGGKIKGVAIGNDPRPVTDRGMTLAQGMNIPFSEMLIVGGYYFHGTLPVQDAFRQPLETLRQIPDLYGSSLSFQMLDPIKGKPEFYPFHHHLPRILKAIREG
ncbi:hypothetical protein [Limnobacter parvus]|uniref:Uncharacterized protein n=1 Tax=Limnobacter parvus TaxID=2939690 RepID=A0ABT1XIU2_9BURK|nr:hypothetical protein [Limnobacter parvus]MCR2747187.1 hypothetical protein [Limnobacter parvus]